MSKNPDPVGPCPVIGKMVVCEVCGHKYIAPSCVVCEKAAENGDWVDHVIEQQEKKKDNDTSDT